MTSPQEALQKAREQDGGWIEHDSKLSPVGATAKVEALDKNGWTTTAAAWLVDWKDIVAYRLHTPTSSSEENP